MMEPMWLFSMTSAVRCPQDDKPLGIWRRALLAAFRVTSEVQAVPKSSGRLSSWLEEQSSVLSSGRDAREAGSEDS